MTRIVIMMLLVRGAKADVSPPSILSYYFEACHYHDRYVQCGDQCIDRNANCHCGPDVFRQGGMFCSKAEQIWIKK